MKQYELSILIPARQEMWLAKTVDDILSNIEANTEIIVVLDGAWADPKVINDPRVTIVYHSTSIGQRAATNEACRISSAKYIMKVDAHCAFDKGFDRKMIEAFKEIGDDVTMVPTMRNLHVFNLVCKDCKNSTYQGPTVDKHGKNVICQKCNGFNWEMEVVWIPKRSPQSNSFCFDSEPHFQYFNELCKRPGYKEEVEKTGLTESMSIQGSCFMVSREKYWELNLCDEAFGSWGSQGIEVAMKMWLSGGRVLANHKTWYAHCFRTQGGTFGFPYPNSGAKIQQAKAFARDLFFNNKWPKQIYPLSWVLDRFWPVRGWDDAARAKITEAGLVFTNLQAEKLGVLGVVPVIPSTVTDHASSVTPDGGRQEVSVAAVGLPGFLGSGPNPTEDISSIRNKSQVSGITAGTVVADMVKDRDILTLSTGNGDNQPGIHKAMGTIDSLVDPDLSISPTKETNPIPASSSIIDDDLLKDPINGLRGDVADSKHIGDFHDTSLSPVTRESKGIIFYTDNLLNLKIAGKVQGQLRRISRDKKIPIVSASLKPMSFGDKNIYLPLTRGYETYFKQIIAALESSTADIIYFCEHDCLYPPEHFDFIPKDKETFYYDHSWFKIGKDNIAVNWSADQVSGLCCYREIALNWYRQKLAAFERDSFDRKFEPMSGAKSESWRSRVPIIDIRHQGALTKNKWSLDDFRDKSTAKDFQETTIDKIPGWKPETLKSVINL